MNRLHWNKNTLTELLKIEYPIIQGPFGGGLSTKDLMIAVCENGGMGSYGAHILPPDQIVDLVKEVKSQTSKTFAINLWVSNADEGIQDIDPETFDTYKTYFQSFYQKLGIDAPAYTGQFSYGFEEQIEALIEASPPAFSFVYGIPSQDIVNRCRQRNIITLGTATTLEEARAIEEAGVDIVIATGFEAGGHRVSFMKRAEECLTGSLALIPQITDKIKIPVVAAGGIADSRGIRAAMALGAQGYRWEPHFWPVMNQEPVICTVKFCALVVS